MGAPGRLGALVRTFRRRAGLTQRELSDLAGVSVAALRDVEQGRVVAPRAGTVRRLIDTLNLSWAESEQVKRAASGGHPASGGVWLGVLGPLRVLVDGVAVDPGSETQRILLGLLALSPNVPVSRDALVEAAWGVRAPVSVVDVLQARISRIRRRMRSCSGPDAAGLLTASQGGYKLTLAEDQLDLLEFRHLCTKARRSRTSGELDAACDLLREAVALWRGEPLAGLAGLESHPEVVALTREHRAAVLDYAAVTAELGRHEEVLPSLQRVAESDPMHEAAHAALMIALAGSGQQAAALRIFDTLRKRLLEDLGSDPGPELVDAYQRVLRQEVVRQGFASAKAHRQLPPDIADFSGREAEIRTLLGGAPVSSNGSTAGAIFSIVGMGGVGKTRLAIRAAHRLLAEGRYADQQLYVDLHGHADQPPADPATVLASFLQLLGVPSDQIPKDLHGRSAMYRDRLYGKNALVLLDNATGEDQVLPLLPAGPTNLVLITSRRVLALDGARSLLLDVFTPEEAREMLVRVVGPDRVRTNPAAVDRVIELCGQLPLAIALAGRRLLSRPAWTFADLTDRLTKTTGRLTELAAGSRQLLAVFDLSYQALDPDVGRVFRLLGLHPGEEFTAESVAALAQLTPPQALRLLDRLKDDQLINAVTGQRYSIHDLLRDYARYRADIEETDLTRREATTRLLDFYLHTTALAADLLHPHRWNSAAVETKPADRPRLATHDDARSWLEAEHACLMAAVALAAEHGWPTHAWRLAHSMRDYLYLYGYTSEWEQTHEAALAAALAAHDPVGEAITRTHLAGTYMNQGRGEEARSHLYRALELHRQSGDRALEASTLGSLGILCYRLGQFPEALRHFTRAASLCAGHDPHSEGVLRTNIGIALTPLGRIDEALDHYRQGLALSRQAGNADGESCVLADLGDAHRRLGQYDTSLHHLKQALALATRNGLVPKEAYVRHRLGNTYRELGLLDEAMANLSEALRIVKTVSGPATESEVLINLGAVHRDAHDFRHAHDLTQQGLKLATTRSEHYQVARALDSLACLYEQSGRWDVAQDHWRRAATLFEELGTPDADAIRLKLTHDRGPVTRTA